MRGLFGRDRHALKSAQRLQRLRHRRLDMPEINLHHFIAVPGAGVGHVQLHMERVIRIDLRLVQLRGVIFELRVAQAVPEGEQGLALEIAVGAVGHGIIQ